VSKLVLYDFGNSVCCQKVRITLRAKGLDWEAVSIDLFKAEQYDAKYLALNPKGVVPTLVHDGKPVIEPAVWLKLKSIRDGADIASARLWGKRAA
jgi:glutathione S-transferase